MSINPGIIVRDKTLVERVWPHDKIAKLNPGVMSSESFDWSTPIPLFNKLDSVFHFDFDAAANAQNTKHKYYLNTKDNALLYAADGIPISWREQVFKKYLQKEILVGSDSCFLNPPYGQFVKPFLRMAYEQAMHFDLTVVALIAFRTDKWFHELVLNRAKYLIGLKQRVRFTRPGVQTEASSPAFPSAIAVFSKRDFNPSIYDLVDIGFVIDLSSCRKQIQNALDRKTIAQASDDAKGVRDGNASE